VTAFSLLSFPFGFTRWSLSFDKVGYKPSPSGLLDDSGFLDLAQFHDQILDVCAEHPCHDMRFWQGSILVVFLGNDGNLDALSINDRARLQVLDLPRLRGRASSNNVPFKNLSFQSCQNDGSGQLSTTQLSTTQLSTTGEPFTTKDTNKIKDKAHGEKLSPQSAHEYMRHREHRARTCDKPSICLLTEGLRRFIVSLGKTFTTECA
jgi:hypothetical protein